MKKTLRELVELQENSKIPNINYSYVQNGPDGTKACIIGAMAVEATGNKYDSGWDSLAEEFGYIKPDDGIAKVGRHEFIDLSWFINALNNEPRYRGRKRMAKLIRKHFSKSLDTVIEF